MEGPKDAPLETAPETCTIITTEVNDFTAIVHDRMPVILKQEDEERWLDPEFHDLKALKTLLKPYSGADMKAYPVSTLVNSPKNDYEECIREVSK